LVLWFEIYYLKKSLQALGYVTIVAGNVEHYLEKAIKIRVLKEILIALYKLSASNSLNARSISEFYCALKFQLPGIFIYDSF
jgi:hypothetical protein